MATRDQRRSGREGFTPGHPPARRRDGLFRFTVDQVGRMADLGFFEGRRVELIEGRLYEMTSNPPHATAQGLLSAALARVLPAGHHLRVALPLDLGRRSQPEPDAALVVGTPRDFAGAHPGTALLVVEISDATLRKDRTLKARLYAGAGLPEYWIVNLVERRLEVHRDPVPDPARPGRHHYRSVTLIPADGRAEPLALPGSRIAVADLLP